jgi:AmmeMemoRadiSam system protein B
MIREPAVCGQFYPATEAAIKKQVHSFESQLKQKKEKVIAIILPHAGYIYSGEVTVKVTEAIEIPENIILVGPNHTGFGPEASIMTKGVWKTPLGDIEINQDVAEKLLKNSKILKDDFSAHIYEHCLEVQLPILQYFSPKFKIVPIILWLLQPEEILALGQSIAKTIKDSGLEKNTLLIASTDMTHYEPEESAKAKDKLAIEQILKLDSQGLLEIVSKNYISMCGVFATATVLEAAKNLGAKLVKLVKYETSAKTSKDYNQVVGYAGLLIK